MNTVKGAKPRFRVGDWATLLFGAERAVAQVIEDRGLLGVNGRRLYRIRMERASTRPIRFEVGEEDLEPATLDRSAVLEYLKDGGLVAMLRSNLGGRKRPPKVWLALTPTGGVRHTFRRRRGIIGGQPAPLLALELREDKVLAASRAEVIDFLAHFGLSASDAEEVIEAVGTVP